MNNSNFHLTDDTYVTRSKRLRLLRMACQAVLMTVPGSKSTNVTIAAHLGCAPSTVARVRRDMALMNMVGTVDAPSPVIDHIPEATFDSLKDRILGCDDYLADRELTEATELANLATSGRDIAASMMKVLRTQGSLPRHLSAVKQGTRLLERMCDALQQAQV